VSGEPVLLLFRDRQRFLVKFEAFEIIAFIKVNYRQITLKPGLDPCIAGSTYYTGYLAAARRLGISAGIGNDMFAPDRVITRQEMFTLLYNALNVIGQLPERVSGKTLSDYSDADEIASWAKDAMKLLVETGIIGSSGSRLDPKGTATRAQMAQVLYCLLSK
jgi:hypothetical protein